MCQFIINQIKKSKGKGPAINDVNQEREGVQKTANCGDFQGITRVTRGGSKILKSRGDVISGRSLKKSPIHINFGHEASTVNIL